MNDYDFSTLNDKEFEQITRDILNAKFDLQLQSFKSGKDKGIDLRFSSSENNNSIVVQSKHFVKSTFSQFKHAMLSKELPKIHLFTPNRYIVVTSLSLSPQNKDELFAGLSPYVISANDIIGREDLNQFLSENAEIEKRYFKLWFSSINVFNLVLNNAVEGRTRTLLEEIAKKIPFYVITKKLDEANEILQREKLLVITGQPGIGKTTLAEILLFERAKNGHKVYKVENVTEAETIISLNKDDKQLFYFDDFLGANYSEIVDSNRTESQLTAFVERVRTTPNKYLILTTRTVILNHAVERYEKINRSKLSNQKFEIKLNDYKRGEKALILYNHLYFRRVSNIIYDTILFGKLYLKIIDHKNYTPRIIEFITELSHFKNLTQEIYIQFVMNNLDNPSEIWRYSYNNQIEYVEKCLLITLFSFENYVFERALFDAFEQRLIYERTVHNQVIYSNQFEKSLKILLDGFVISEMTTIEPPLRRYRFINPSLGDFFIGYMKESYQERKNLISSICFVEQLERFDPEKSKIPLEKELQIIVREKIASGSLKFLKDNSTFFTDLERNATILAILCKYCRDVNVDSLLTYYLKQLNFTKGWFNIADQIEFVLLNLGDAPVALDFIKENFYEVLDKFLSFTKEPKSAVKLPFIFAKFGFNYDDFVTSELGFVKVTEFIESVLSDVEEERKNERENEVTGLDEVSEIYKELNNIDTEIRLQLLPDELEILGGRIALDTYFWENKIEENLKRSSENASSEKDYRSFYDKQRQDNVNEAIYIDNLFSSWLE